MTHATLLLLALLLGSAAPSLAAQGIRPLEGVTPVVLLPPEQCVGVVRPESAGRGPTPGYVDITPHIMVLPPAELTAKLRRGDTLRTTIIYSLSGTVDSVTITGGPDAKGASRAADQLRKTLSRYQYSPATYNGCVVRGIQEYKVAEGPDGANQRRPLQRSWKNP